MYYSIHDRNIQEQNVTKVRKKYAGSQKNKLPYLNGSFNRQYAYLRRLCSSCNRMQSISLWAFLLLGAARIRIESSKK